MTKELEIPVIHKVSRLKNDALLILGTEDPAMNARYGGTIGRTHGDKKLSMPAKNEIKIDIKPESSVSS